MFLLVLAVGDLAGCGSDAGLGGPREQPEPTAVAKSPPPVARGKRPLPRNVIPGASNRDVKGKYAD